MAISYVPQPPPTPSPRSAIKAAKDKYFNADQSSRSNSIASVHDDPAGFGVSSTSSFEEIQQGPGIEKGEIIENIDMKHTFSMEFSSVVREAVSAAARRTDGVSSNVSTLARANSVPKPPRQSLELDKNGEELQPLLEKESVTPPPLPESPVPKTDKVLEFAKSNVN